MVKFSQPPQPDRTLRRVTRDMDPLLPGEEAEWIRAAQSGDRSAFACLIERYWDLLYRYLFRMTRNRHSAEDLTQETFLKALAAVGTFRAGTNFRAWVFAIGHNNFVNQKRAERRAKLPLPEDAAAPMSGTAETTTENREALEAVARAVAELPADFRAALTLRVEQGLSFREVARILNTTEETARWRVFKARQKLMKVLAPELLPPGAVPDEAGT
jgi:RNA polymerase sigma-70 factor (ECF subfamily)